jgi:predicted N-formylglutamate amidohydrolase
MTETFEAEIDHAFEALGGHARSSVFLTAEHAKERFPVGYTLPPADAWLAGTHWAYDLGVEPLVRELSGTLAAPAVLAGFSRLLVDPNRAEHEETLFRVEAEGRRIELNAALPVPERERRLSVLYRPYHQAIDARLGASRSEILFSVHSFTPVYEGAVREMELGVLFNREDDLAERMRRALERDGFRVAMNEPYSGKEGLIHAAERHADAHGRRAIELEVRQDLAVDAGFRARLVRSLGRFF